MSGMEFIAVTRLTKHFTVYLSLTLPRRQVNLLSKNDIEVEEISKCQTCCVETTAHFLKKAVTRSWCFGYHRYGHDVIKSMSYHSTMRAHACSSAPVPARAGYVAQRAHKTGASGATYCAPRGASTRRAACFPVSGGERVRVPTLCFSVHFSVVEVWTSQIVERLYTRALGPSSREASAIGRVVVLCFVKCLLVE